jgi:glutathione S-transferase
MKLYQTYASPFPTRVRLLIYAKDLKVEIIEPPGFHASTEPKGDYLKINPNGKVPTMVDGDFKLFESMAINLYLAAKHGKDGFFPASLEDQALCHQWSFWGMTEVEKPLLTVLIDMFMTPPDKRKPDAVAEALRALPRPFGVLNGALQGRDYLLGGQFTVADLNLASICSWARPIKYDFTPFPNVTARISIASADRCAGLPSGRCSPGISTTGGHTHCLYGLLHLAHWGPMLLYSVLSGTAW